MKKNCIPAWLILALSAVAVIGSFTFLSPCIHTDGSFGACHWAGRMLSGIGCLTGILAVLALAVRKFRAGMYISIIPVCILGLLTPGSLISLCMMSTMRCRAIMRPAMLLLFAAMLVLAVTGALAGRKD